MKFEGEAAVAAGLIGGSVMALLLYMGIAMMATQMKMNLFRLLGIMLLEEGMAAYMLGSMVHAMMSLLFGAGHWMIVGMALEMMRMMHRGIRDGSIDTPGSYVLSYPRMTAMGFLMLHLVYGILVDTFYAAFT